MYECRHCGKPTEYCDLVCDSCFEEFGAVDLMVDIKNTPKRKAEDESTEGREANIDTG